MGHAVYPAVEFSEVGGEHGLLPTGRGRSDSVRAEGGRWFLPTDPEAPVHRVQATQDGEQCGGEGSLPEVGEPWFFWPGCGGKICARFVKE